MAMKRIALATAFAASVVGLSMGSANAQSAGGEAYFHVGGNAEVLDKCAFGEPYNFPPAHVYNEAEHGLVSKVELYGAESWLSCNTAATIKTEVLTTGSEHAICGFKIASDVDPLDGIYGYHACSTTTKLDESVELDIKDAKLVGQWYTVYAEGKYEDGYQLPLPAGEYTWQIHQTATPL